MYKYVSSNKDIIIDSKVVLTNQQVLEAIQLTNDNLRKIHDVAAESGIEIFDALGLRNLSGFIGEFLVSSIEKISNQCLLKNPHQDGYPDLFLIDSTDKKKYFESIIIRTGEKVHLKEKKLFSPFKYGGIEVKATCGETPPAKEVPKPLIGEQRISLLKKFDWKSHHRETNNLIGIYWDFIEGLPVICALFYRNDLEQNDWGKIVQPKIGGGRTTSVSIMKTSGVKKMCSHWIAVIDSENYIDKLSSKKWIGEKIN